ncbi:MAG: hypothetical protein JWL85_678 [Candidatus Saccharibacteria bacterium]|nr:hypothetical protein [Candidatus Saccharibacteria bacterium]
MCNGISGSRKITLTSYIVIYLICLCAERHILTGMNLRITTLNLQGYVEWEARQKSIAEYLQATSPHIVLFQEVVFIPELWPYNRASMLTHALKYSYEDSAVTRLQDSSEYADHREGLATLSELAIVRSEILVLKQAPNDRYQRIVQLLDFVHNEVDIIKVANVHLSTEDHIARTHLEELLSILAARGETRIIGGDFNMQHLNDHSDLWQDKYTASSSEPYISFPEGNQQIDYFLVPKEYQLAGVSTSPDGLSDHRAVTVNIVLG